MNETTLICENEQRRHEVRQQREDWNGLDYLEVGDDQLTLTLYFINKAPADILAENVIIEGGRRITGIKVRVLQVCPVPEEDRDDCVKVWLDKFGDFSTYTLRLVAIDQRKRPIMDTDALGRKSYRPMPGIDPRYAQLEFSFKVGCPTDLDCLDQGPVCPPEVWAEPEIDYLAKDYASFRQLILDRLALIMPDWQERHVPDLGIALVELLAYAGDYLSQYQDAVATEAYLQMARRRISVRRHARLVDYRMHEGCNARAWLHVHAPNDALLDPADVFFITGETLQLPGNVVTEDDLRYIPADRYEVFEPWIETDPAFRRRDFKDPTGLVARLCDAQDEPSASLRRRFSAETRELLEAYPGTGVPSGALQEALAEELNRLLQGSRLYHEGPFRIPELAAEVRSPTVRPMSEQERVRLNRLHLERIYPGEIVEHEKLHLYQAHNEIRFYTWHDQECCLPRGATSATLVDGPSGELAPIGGEEDDVVQAAVALQAAVAQKPPDEDDAGEPAQEWVYQRVLQLQPGDLLLFQEVKDPKTGQEPDADPRRRHVVRLTAVEPLVDELYHQPVLAIEWEEQDALPFPLCISALRQEPPCEVIQDISVARGNILLVDHGRHLGAAEDLDTVPAKTIRQTCERENRPSDVYVEPERYRPVLAEGPLTFRQPRPERAPASRLLDQDPRQARPQITLESVAPFVGPSGPEPLFGVDRLTDRAQLASLVTVLQEVGQGVEPEGIDRLRPLFSARTWQSLAEYEGHGPLPDFLEQAIRQELDQQLPLLRTLCVMLTGQQGDVCEFSIELDEKGQACLRFGDTFIPLKVSRPDTAWTTKQLRIVRLYRLLLPETRQLLEEHTDPGSVPDSVLDALAKDLERLLELWTPVLDLLGSGADDRHFVVEMDNRQRAHLRFGDGELGQMPAAGTAFRARYRVGNGPAGNVGAGTISHIVFRQAAISGLDLLPSNPLPARGGTAPESLAQAKLFAPYAFRTRLERAITADDYVKLVMHGYSREAAIAAHASHSLIRDKVQRAAATLRWNGSWYEVMVAIDPKGAVVADQALLQEIEAYLRHYKRIGHDLTVALAEYVPLYIKLKVCVLSGYLSAHVKGALLALFSNRRLPDGRLGFFHPDNLTFGQGIRLSRLVALARSVPGVDNVSVVELRRYGAPPGDAIETGILPIGALEIARLDNDPNFAENGLFELEMVGGR
jgi:predicted phage baseplate assembly protein